MTKAGIATKKANPQWIRFYYRKVIILIQLSELPR